MTTDGTPWRSGAANFDDVGFSLVKRDIEVIMLALQQLQQLQQSAAAAGISSSDLANMIAGMLPWAINQGGTGATDAPTARTNLGLGALATKSVVDLTADVTNALPWDHIATVAWQTAPDNTDTTDATPFVITSTYSPTNWQVYFKLYEKRPRYNAKWLQGQLIDTTAPTTASQFLWWDKTNSKWAAFDWNLAATTVGDINAYDPATADTNGKLTSCHAGKAYTVFGNKTAANALPDGIPIADGQVLGRVSTTMGGTSTPVLGTNASGGGTLRVYFAAGKYVDISATGIVTVFQSATSQVSIDASSTVTVQYNTNKVEIKATDFGADTSQTVKLTKIAECDSTGAAKSRYYLCGAQF